jgi:hypothetical protein
MVSYKQLIEKSCLRNKYLNKSPSQTARFSLQLFDIFMTNQQSVRDLLLEQLQGGKAHVDFSRAVKGLKLNDLEMRLQKQPYSIWELAEHIRIAQHDIVDFCRNPDYKSISWPDGYWPDSHRPEDQQQWEDTIEAFHRDHSAMVELIGDLDNDLLTPLPHGDGQTLFREAMLIVDHNAYHIGQIVLLRKSMGNW